MRRYETIFILRPNLGEIQLKQSLKRVEDIVANGGGDLIETDEWGMRELAYRIKRERRGYYVRLDYVATGAVMNEVERNLKLMDESLRHLSVMVEEEADAAHLRSEVEARQRRLAEARAAASGETHQVGGATCGAGGRTHRRGAGWPNRRRARNPPHPMRRPNSLTHRRKPRMAPTRIELSGRLVKPPHLGSTPSGRAVLRLSLDCGAAGEPLPLDVVVTDHEARQLARDLTAGQRIWATGFVNRGAAALGHRLVRAASRRVAFRLEVMANAVGPEGLDSGSDSLNRSDSLDRSTQAADVNTRAGRFSLRRFRRWPRTIILKRLANAAVSRVRVDPAMGIGGWKGVLGIAAECAGGPVDGARFAAFAPTRP